MNETTDIVVDTTARIFTDLGDPQAIINARNRDGGDGWKDALWAALEESGLTRAWVPEALGGAGLDATDTFALLRVAGARAVAVPLAETLLASWALARANIAPPDGRLAIAVEGEMKLDGNGRVSGTAAAVPFARDSAHLVVLSGDDRPTLALVETAHARIEHGVDLAGEPLDAVVLDSAPTVATAPLAAGREAVRRMGAAVRASLIAGGLDGLLAMSVAYAQERKAFTRTISRFQAVQHLLARLAEETAASVAAASSAAFAVEQDPDLASDRTFIEVAAAKIRAGEAATEGARIAHQVHGAIGFTDEHPLHRLVHRVWAWRDDCGDETYWAVRLGERFAGAGGAALWPAVTAA